MRTCVAVTALTLALGVAGCTRRDSDGRDRSAAREAGRAAYTLSQKSKEAARRAARELKEAGKEARQGWNERKREAGK